MAWSYWRIVIIPGGPRHSQPCSFEAATAGGRCSKLSSSFLRNGECRWLFKAAAAQNGSQGTFRPFFDEQNDGEDTVKWMERQPWFTGDLALWGISYLGNTAWAVANSSVRDRVKAISFHVTLTNFRDRTYAFDGFTLLSCIGWTATMLSVFRNSGMNMLSAMLGARKTRALTEQAIDDRAAAQGRPCSYTGRCFLVAGLDGSRRTRRPLVGRDRLWPCGRDHSPFCDDRGVA